MMIRVVLTTALFLAMAASTAYGQAGGLREGCYSATCPYGEAIVRSIVESHFRTNPVVALKLLRKHFHDCFVQGCDASILIDGQNTEKNAGRNLSIGPAYAVINDAKMQLEAGLDADISHLHHRSLELYVEVQPGQSPNA